MGVHLDTKSDVAVLKLGGNFFSDTEKLRKAIKELTDAGNVALVIDLGAVCRMDSMALGVLVGAHTSYVKRGGRVILADLDRNMQDLLAITKLARVFEIGPTLPDALRKLGVPE